MLRYTYAKKLQNHQLTFGFQTKMSLNRHIFVDLCDMKSTPSASNDLYVLDVQDWCWKSLGEKGIWNFNAKCRCYDEWVHKISYNFTKYAKKVWKASAKTLLSGSSNKVWLDTAIEFPDKLECPCLDQNGIVEDVVQVKSIFRPLV